MRSSWNNLAAAAFGLILAACGGGGGGGGDGAAPVNPPAPQKFASTDDVAAAYRATELAVLSEFFAYSVDGTNSAAASAKAVSIDQSNAIAPASLRDRAGTHSGPAPLSVTVTPKAATSYTCSGSGSYTFATDDSTTYTSDGTEIDSQCVEVSSSNGTETSRTTYNGQYVSKCVDSAQTTSNCTSYDDTYGTGSSAPYLVAYKEAASGGQDTVEKDAVHRPYLSSGNTTRASADGSISYLDNVSGRAATFGFTGFVTDLNNSTGSTLEKVSGTLSLSGNLKKCLTLSSITVATPQGVPVDSNFNPTGGSINVTDPSGQAVPVTFASNGSATVTVGGKTQTYTRAQLNALCI